MRKLTLPAILITILAPGLALSDSRSCIYDGINYFPYETVSFISSEYTQELKDAGYSADGYTLVLTCSPVVEPEMIATNSFSVSSIPAQKSVWVPLTPYPTHKPNTLNRLTITGKTE